MTDEKPKDLNTLLDEWFVSKRELDALTIKENALRVEIMARFVVLHAEQYPNKEIKRGQNKVKIDHGMALVIDNRINYSIDRAGLEAAMAAAGENERPIIESIISYSPKVKDAAFEALAGDDLQLVTPFITAKPGLPGVEIKPQNKVRW